MAVGCHLTSENPLWIMHFLQALKGTITMLALLILYKKVVEL